MLDAALVLLRLGQFGGAAVLLGAPLFRLYRLRAADPAHAWARPLAAAAAVTLAISAGLALVLQTGAMAGDLRAAADPGLLAEVVRPFPSAARWRCVCSQASSPSASAASPRPDGGCGRSCRCSAACRS